MRDPDESVEVLRWMSSAERGSKPFFTAEKAKDVLHVRRKTPFAWCLKVSPASYGTLIGQRYTGYCEHTCVVVR